MKRGRGIGGENTRRLENKDGTDSLSSREHAVAHGGGNRRRLRGGGWEEAIESGIDGQAVFLEEWGKVHRCKELPRREMRERVKNQSPAQARTARRATGRWSYLRGYSH